MIDSHTHLHMCEPDDAELVAAAAGAGVDRMLTVGIDPDSCRAALATAEAHPPVRAAVGRHPNAATGFDLADLADLQALAAHPRCAAVGETGLDFFRDETPARDQQRAFEAQIELARDLGKPLVIHTRAAADATVATLASRAEGVRVIMHCFTLADRVDECVDHGWWISYAGNVTYPRNSDLRDSVARVPLDRLLVETDAPFLTPQPQRRHRNQPAFVVHTAEVVAQARGLELPELEQAVERNAAELFGW